MLYIFETLDKLPNFHFLKKKKKDNNITYLTGLL